MKTMTVRAGCARCNRDRRKGIYGSHTRNAARRRGRSPLRDRCLHGLDRLADIFLSPRQMRERVGRKVLRAFAGAAPEKRITFTMPWDPRVWEVRRGGGIVPWCGGG